MSRIDTALENSYLVTWTVEPGENGLRLDLFLKEKYRTLSRERIQKSIKDGRTTVNHDQTKPSRLLKTGDKVFVLSVKGNEPPVDLNYKIIYEDDTILVVDKPGNLPVHPVGRYFFNSLLTQLRIVNRNEIDQTRNFYLVHRIDRETSGVLVMGKLPEAATNLVEQFSNRETAKEYLAIVRGRMEKDHYSVNAPMARDAKSDIRLKMGVVEYDKLGKALYVEEKDILQAKTDFDVLERIGNYSIVRCKPHTGRQHQIRVHLMHIGFPIVGDKLYGVSDDVFYESLKGPLTIEVEPGISVSRHALHAHRLTFTHPKTREKKEFVSEFPHELRVFLDKVKKS